MIAAIGTDTPLNARLLHTASGFEFMVAAIGERRYAAQRSPIAYGERSKRQCTVYAKFADTLFSKL